MPIASHIPSQENLIADFLSRGRVLPSEWTLHPRMMRRLLQAFSPLQVGLFASALNANLLTHCARMQDLASWRIDAFSFWWTGLRAYAFPPFSLIPRVLRKIHEDRAWMILIALWWLQRTWYQEIVDLLANHSLELSSLRPVSEAKQQQLQRAPPLWPL